VLLQLMMALYGLRQSAREWAITLREWLLGWTYEDQRTFRRMGSDSYVFVWDLKGRGKLILLLWVDDIFMAHSCIKMRSAFMEAFSKRFRVKDLGPMSQGLGAKVIQDLIAGTVAFSQERQIMDAARRFNLHVDNTWADIPVPTASVKKLREAKPNETEREQYVAECRALAGVLTQICTFSRPDIAFGTMLVASSPPSKERLELSRRILGYVARTASKCITYRKGVNLGASMSVVTMDGEHDKTGLPHMAVDADHGTERSCTGWLMFLAGAAVSWAVRWQLLPSLSSTEAELYGLSTAVCDLIVTANVIEEIGYEISGKVKVFCDSRGARLLVADCAAPQRTRHIHRRWFFVRHHAESGRLVVSEVKGANNPANFMTKAVGGASFNHDRGIALGEP